MAHLFALEAHYAEPQPLHQAAPDDYWKRKLIKHIERVLKPFLIRIIGVVFIADVEAHLVSYSDISGSCAAVKTPAKALNVQPLFAGIFPIDDGQACSCIEDRINCAALALDLNCTSELHWIIIGYEGSLKRVNREQRINAGLLWCFIEIVQVLRRRRWQFRAITLDMIRAIAMPASFRLLIRLLVIIVVI